MNRKKIIADKIWNHKFLCRCSDEQMANEILKEMGVDELIKERDQWKSLYQKRGKIMKEWIEKYDLPIDEATLG